MLILSFDLDKTFLTSNKWKILSQLCLSITIACLCLSVEYAFCNHKRKPNKKTTHQWSLVKWLSYMDKMLIGHMFQLFLVCTGRYFNFWPFCHSGADWDYLRTRRDSDLMIRGCFQLLKVLAVNGYVVGLDITYFAFSLCWPLIFQLFCTCHAGDKSQRKFAF